MSTKHPEPKESAFALSDRIFSSIGHEEFRVHLTPESKGAFRLWIENQNSKKQWEAVFVDVKDCGPAGVPKKFVLESLEAALVKSCNSTFCEDVDMQIIENVASIFLQISVASSWQMEFKFLLTEIVLEKVDVLESKLRDALTSLEVAEKRIFELENRQERAAVLSVCSKHSASANTHIQWNGTSPTCSVNNFVMSANQSEITVVDSGIYQIDARVSSTNTSNTQDGILEVQVNGKTIGSCVMGNNTGYYISGHVFEIVSLEANNVITVLTKGNGSILSKEASNRLTILKIPGIVG